MWIMYKLGPIVLMYRVVDDMFYIFFILFLFWCLFSWLHVVWLMNCEDDTDTRVAERITTPHSLMVKSKKIHLYI